MSQRNRQIWVAVNGERFLVEVEDLSQEPVVVYVDGNRYEVSLEGEDESANPLEGVQRKPGTEISPHSVPAGTSCDVTAPMPGDVVEVLVAVGQAVQPGDPLCVLDAMKMKNTIHAPQAGRVREICVREGQAVEYGTPLFSLE